MNVTKRHHQSRSQTQRRRILSVQFVLQQDGDAALNLWCEFAPSLTRATETPLLSASYQTGLERDPVLDYAVHSPKQGGQGESFGVAIRRFNPGMDEDSIEVDTQTMIALYVDCPAPALTMIIQEMTVNNHCTSCNTLRDLSTDKTAFDESI